MNQENKVVKISDVIQNQIPEFIFSENPNFGEFLKQYYISQEFQGSSADLAENLIAYKNIDSFDNTNLISQTTLSLDVDFFDDTINVESTAGWPKEYGLLKIDNEIITYTGITSTSFIGCIRGFSGTSSLSDKNNPEFLVFSQTEIDTHSLGSIVENLSNLFLKEFFKKIKYHFTPGFEELEFTPEINPQNFISKAKSFYQTKGTDEAFNILFKVLYNQDVKVIKPIEYCFTTSDDRWKVVETFICEIVSGNPFNIKGQTLYQDSFPQYDISDANGSIYNVESFRIKEEIFYKLQIFSGYSNNLNPKGSIKGTFSTSPKTFVVEDIVEGSTVITVDSTVGFSNQGILEINGIEIEYSDKTNNQFLNCTNVTSNIPRKSKVFSDHFVYAYEENSSNLVKFKICNVLSKLKDSNVLFAYDNDPIEIEQLGSTESSIFGNSLIYNHAISVTCGKAITSITSKIRTNQKEAFSITNGISLCKTPHKFKYNDVVDMYVENTNQLIASNLSVTYINPLEFSVPILSISQQYGDLQNLLGKSILFRRRLKKSTYNDLSLIANIQDSYIDSDYYYVTSNGLPEYQINPLTFDKSFDVVNETTLETNDIHHFYSGEEVTVVTYSTTLNYQNQIGISTGNSYYVTRVSSFEIQLSQSKEDVESSLNIPLIEYDTNNNVTGSIISVSLVPSSQYNETFGSSKLFKKFTKHPKITEIKESTPPGSLGIFVNGIELKNYKSFDKIYYGPIDSITVLNSGKNYNLYNPPKFEVIGGTYTNIIPQLKGNLVTLSVTDPGFDYTEVPTVKVLGGNNSTVVTQVKMKNVINEVKFNASTKDTVIDTVNNKFLFKSRHRFITGEPVIYKNLGTNSIGIGTAPSDGYLSNDSIYYVVNVGAGTSMKIAFTKEDAFSEENLINLRTYGGGIQSFISTIPKKGIDEVNVIQNDKDFEYKKVSFIDTDVNYQDNIINIKNHGFSTGDEILFTWISNGGFNGDTISGLVSGEYYYVIKINDDNLKLSLSKDSTDSINLISGESNTTYFLEYSPIRVEIYGTTSVNGTSDVGYDATILPIIKGSVVGAVVQKNPIDYNDVFGNKNILNYEKNPKITVIEGEGASFQPLVVDGKINQVIIKNPGFNYFNSIELSVFGSGFGAKLEPIIVDGQITGVEIVNGGVGYSQNDTIVKIIPIGTGVKLKANLKSWYVNNVVKYGNFIDDGSIFGKNYSFAGNSYGVYFLTEKLNQYLNISNSPNSHSPIVGWSYDGCPIYGPYAYANRDGSGGIIKMRSGYSYTNSVGSIYNLVEEYIFTDSGTLDEHNGRFCVTPEYPNGVYAYFCTLDDNDTPVFPYIIGPKYNCQIIQENFDLKNNQELNLNNLDISKWTLPYRIYDDFKYEYFEITKNYNKKDIVIQKTSEGFVDEIQILNPGLNYQVNESLVFNNDYTSGFGAIAKISEISGVGISTIKTENKLFSNVTFISDGSVVIGIASTYHSLKDKSSINISGISTSSFESIEGFRQIDVFNISTKLTSGISSSSVTGVVTSIQIADPISFFDIDSQLKLNNEVMKVIGLDYKNNLINVLRPQNSPSHVEFESIDLLQNKFSFSAINFTSSYSEKNESYYFNSVQSVSLGTDTSPGVGNTLTIYPLGYGIPYIKYVQTGGIYLPNNNFNSGDKVTYTSGTSTIVTNYGNLNLFEELYVLKIEDDVVGLVTSRSDISNPNKILTYTASGTGNLHKFTTNRNIVTGNIIENTCIVSTAATHGLSENNIIKLNVTSGITTTVLVTYSNNRILINSQVNPQINFYYNDIVIFDLSDPSLSGKNFNLYTDENFDNEYFGNIDNGIEVYKTNEELKLTISKYTPSNLYYNLSETVSDITVNNYNQLTIKNSLYNNKFTIKEVSSKQFKFDLNVDPERSIYTDPSDLSYAVLSEGVLGPISKIEIISKGNQYKKLPKVYSVNTSYGTGCDLFANSYSIGKIQKTKVNNTQLICPFDKTLNPSSKVFSAVKLTDNYSVSNLEILTTGKNYIFSPKIELYNKTDNQITYSFLAAPILKGGSIDSIEIISPGYGLKSNDNQIVVVNNTNGFNIINAAVSGSFPYTVTLTLKTPISGFTTSNPLPISIGDEIFVEGINGSGNGFNSKDYKYQPFMVTSVDPAYGSQDAATVEYELDVNPGSYDGEITINSYVTPYSYIPKINAILTENNFYNKELVNDNELIDNDKNEPITNLLKVKQINNLNVNDIITGKPSRSKGKIIGIDNFNSIFVSDSSVSEILGENTNRGYLSSNIQKLSDNDYYQNFSYSLKSKKSFDDWNSPVSDISHIVGYKKFGDLVIESVGIGTTQSIKTDETSTLNVVLNSYVNVNSISNYDLVSEVDIEDTEYEYSQYLKFGKLKFGQSLKSIDNRVLSIDDISNLFNTLPTVPKITIDNIFSATSTALKYIFYLTSTNSFLGDFLYPETFEVLVSRQDDNITLTSYSYYFDIQTLGQGAFFGEFTAEVNSNNENEILLYFQPNNPFLSVDIKSIKEISPNTVGIATTTFGYVKNVELCEEYAASGSPTPQVFYSIPTSECNSGTLIVGISSSSYNVQKCFEASFINTNNDILISKYAENIFTDLGSIGISTNGSNIEFSYTGVAGIGVTVQINLKLLTNTYAGYYSIDNNFSTLSSSQILTNSSSTGISTVSGIYGFTKYIMEISQDTGISTQRSLVQINSIHSGDYLNNTVYDNNGNIDLNDLNFETTYDLMSNQYTLFFNPITSANYNIIIYEASLLSPNQ